ncbi:MAG: hypothetical protein Q4F11_06020 [Eubacteriales bacterium]|nr:hypothetical protein [Eubacteriales bacterium]
MKYPCLVLARYCKTPVKVKIEQEGINEYGDKLPKISWIGQCNYQSKGRTVLTADKKLIQLSGRALIPGDICPELPEITAGTIEVDGVVRTIYQGAKERNPDGTVNHTRLDVK